MSNNQSTPLCSLPGATAVRNHWRSEACFAPVAAFAILACTAASYANGEEMQRIRVSDNQRGFVLEPSGRPFIAWGFNYDHDENGRLLEEYWETEWAKVAEDFQEMRDLGANVVRIHLQFGKFMERPDKPNEEALERLGRLVALAENTKLYLDITGLACYLKEQVPTWYDDLDEKERWEAQAAFWKAVINRCVASPAIFCYDLMNEPVVPGGKRNARDWLGQPFAGKFHFVQVITLDQADRPRPQVARQWIHRLASAIREVDRQHLITVGLVPWSLDRPGLTSGFVPREIVDELDFISVHLYPEKSKVDEAIETLSGFAVGKPVVIEEMFPLHSPLPEFSHFIERSRGTVAGWIGFYWGKTPAECRQSKTIADAIMLRWLEFFEREARKIESN